MAQFTTPDGVGLHYEEHGAGIPVLFIHEFAGDHRSWQPQVRRFSRAYRCITYNARGYPPSDVPADPSAYSMNVAVADAVAVLDHLQIEQAHIVGISMGGFTTLHLGLRHPERALSLTVAGAGYGAPPDKQQGFRDECEVIARAFETEGARTVAERYSQGPARVQFQNKDPHGWAEFATQLGEHSSVGSAMTMRGVQMGRPSLYDLTDELAALTVPTLIVTGDEDEGCLEPDLMLKRTIPSAGLLVVPRTGHTVNLEEPELFNSVLADFWVRAEHDAWGLRDPRSLTTSTTGMDEDIDEDPNVGSAAGSTSEHQEDAESPTFDYDEQTALIVVDVQNDFADPRGSLYVKGGEEVPAVINREIAAARQAGATVVYTADWHPEHTPHFAKDGGIWPDHCVAGTWGAEFHPDLDVKGTMVRKGTGGEDGYSGFTVEDPVTHERAETGMDELLRTHGIHKVVVVGLATDYCVKATALDARAKGYDTTVLTRAVRAVNLEEGDGEKALAEMAQAGIHIV